ncbi:MAG: hypothetical protein ACRBBT_10395 [Paracoccaceae bacterium]
MGQSFRLAVFIAITAASAAQADIRPLSGTWQGASQLTGQSGCPPDMTSAAPTSGGYAPRYIAFPDVFDGAAIAGDFTWVRVAENHWRAQDTQSRSTPLGALRISFVHDLYVESETNMRQLSSLTARFPAAMAQMLGGASQCTMTSRVDHARIGD